MICSGRRPTRRSSSTCTPSGTGASASSTAAVPGPHDDEGRRQIAHLAALVDDLQTRSDRAGQGEGYGLVVDTNIFAALPAA